MSMCTELARPGASSATDVLSLFGWHSLRREYVYSEKKGVMGAISTDIVVSTSYIQYRPGGARKVGKCASEIETRVKANRTVDNKVLPVTTQKSKCRVTKTAEDSSNDSKHPTNNR